MSTLGAMVLIFCVLIALFAVGIFIGEWMDRGR